MNSRLIYLDTNIWNRLIDQHVAPQSLLVELAKTGWNIALSGQTIYELSKTFRGSRATASVRGQALFRYLKSYVDAEIPCACDNMGQLHGEIAALNTFASEVVAFFGPEKYAELKIEVDKLAMGYFNRNAENFVLDRKQFSQSTRSNQQRHLQLRHDVKLRLSCISRNQLPSWLETETASEAGCTILADHLLRMYTNLSEETAIKNARALLQIPHSRIAKGVVRADLYFNWRCANRGSNSSDLVDDLYHVLNASYSDVYATAESAQREYASLILSRWTRVEIYDDLSPVDAWLLSLVNSAAPHPAYTTT